MSQVHRDRVAPSLLVAATAGTWIRPVPARQPRSLEPAVPAGRAGRGALLLRQVRAPLPVPGHHDTTSVGCSVPAEPRTTATFAGLLSTSASLLPQRLRAGPSPPHAMELFQRRGSGLAVSCVLGLWLFLPPRVLLGPGATLLCRRRAADSGPECFLSGPWRWATGPPTPPTPRPDARTPPEALVADGSEAASMAARQLGHMTPLTTWVGISPVCKA